MGNFIVKQNKKVLIFTAHPDDHLCAAGLVMFLVNKGFSATEVVFTGGEKSVDLKLKKGPQAIDPEKLKKVRQKELSTSSRILGISKTVFLGLPDSEIERSMFLLNKIVQLVRQEKPQIVITMHPCDLHYDHKMVGKIVSEAIERAAWSNSADLGASHTVLVTLFMEGLTFGRTDLLVDITKFAARKNKAVLAFRSQITREEKKMLEGMNAFHGFQKGGDIAEAFEIAGNLPIHFNELVEIFGA